MKLLYFPVLFLCIFFTAQTLDAADCDDPMHLALGRKRSRSPTLSPVEVMTLYVSDRLEEREGVLHKTKVHKLLYFANGLHHAFVGAQIIDIPFKGNRYGPFMQDIQNLFEAGCCEAPRRKSLLQTQPPAREIKDLSDVVVDMLGGYSATQLSNFTHEPLTPWSQITAGGAELMRNIPHDLNQQYFSCPDTVARFFIAPYIRGAVPLGEYAIDVLSRLLTRYPLAFSSFIGSQLESFREAIQLRDTVERVVYEFAEGTRGVQLYDVVFRRHLGSIFAHSQQSVVEGALAEALFESDFIARNEAQLFFDNNFRHLIALGAKYKNLSSLHYLKRIFEAFSEQDGDFASGYATEVGARIQNIARAVVARELPPDPSWQVLYERVLALTYQNPPADSEAITKLIDQALAQELPSKHKKDLLKRGFHLSADRKYVDQGIAAGFQEFRTYQAANAGSLGEAFAFLEHGIQGDVPEACFEAGKSILRHGYVVLPTSALWAKYLVAPPETVVVNGSYKERLVTLGEKLLAQSIHSGVQEALVLWLDLCGDNLGRALEVCDHAGDKAWAIYQRARIQEKQHKLAEAIEDYKGAGPLIGYVDAARLSAKEEETRLLREYERYKKETLNTLYSTFQ